MSIEEIRAIQKNKQITAIDQRRSAESITRIGDRDPLTGRFQVLDSDGGVLPQGVKVYNAQEQYGDRVLPFPRTDGTIALDSEKGSVIKPPTAFPHCPGYLYGQVFNCEVPKKKKPGNVWILYAYEGRFYVGGHQRDGELVYDPIPPNMPIFDRDSSTSMQAFSFQIRENYAAVAGYGAVWGDEDGWEANYSTRHPKTLCLATSESIKTYANFQRNGNYIYLGGWLGKGFWVEQYDFVRQGANGGDAGVGFSDTWKNAIVDHDGFKSSTGSLSEVWSQPGTRQIKTGSSVDTYPEPYLPKNKNESHSSNTHHAPIGTPPTEPNFGFRITNDSSEILFRDRSSALFYSSSSSWTIPSLERVVSGIEFSTTSLLDVTPPRKVETKLLQLQGRSQSVTSQLSGKLFGMERFGGMRGYDLRRYKYNNPSVTLVDDWSTLRTNNLNFEVKCKVKIYSITNKESLVEGDHKEEELTCWGVPQSAIIVDVCAWVP